MRLTTYFLSRILKILTREKHLIIDKRGFDF